MKMKAVFISILCLMIFAGCGYRIALPGLKPTFTIYVSKIENNSDEVDGYRLFSNEINSYLASIDAAAKEGNSDYTAMFTLDKVSLSPAVKLKSGQTTTVDVVVTMTAVVRDKTGKVVLEKPFSAVSSYSQAYSLSLSMANREDAITEAVRINMENFRYALEHK